MTDAWTTVRAAWPHGSVSRADFERELAAQKERVAFPADLYWACCCLAGDRPALVLLEKHVAKQLMMRGGLDAEQRAELAGIVMAQLVVGGAERRPKLEQYAGRAPLDGWVHVVVTRLVIDAQRSAAPRNDDAQFEEAMLGASGELLPPDVELAREQFRGTFAAAFRTALASLEPRERLLLRQHYLDGVSLEALAKSQGVGRSTVARWLQTSRANVMTVMREEIRLHTGLRGKQIDSVLRVVQSRLELTMSALRQG